jgi:pimeloyl-ACP methyl ester carboxylesterase
MGEYVDLPGVKTWYEVEGSGEPLLLLHGGLVGNESWAAQRPAFTAQYKTFLPERRAHGHTPDVDGPLHYQDMADDMIDFIEAVIGEPAHLVGWSDGGIVGLLAAIARPDLVLKLVAIGANFLPAPEIGPMEQVLEGLVPDNPGLATFRSMYEAASPDGPEHWIEFIPKMAEMWRREPNISVEDLGRISARTLVLVGDDDAMSLEHTVALYRAIPNSELAVVPGTSHVLVMEKPDLVNGVVLDFLGNDPVPTFAPVRRAEASAPAH